MIYVPRWLFGITIYIIIVYIIIKYKPSLMFDSYGNPKNFGLGISEGNSVLAPVFIFPILALLSYFIAAVLQFII